MVVFGMSSSPSSKLSRLLQGESLAGWLAHTLAAGKRSALLIPDNHPIWLLGVDHSDHPDFFYLDFVSRIWLTYRSHLAHPITADNHRRWQWSSHKSWSSDAGWGCMLRTGQSLLANALIHARLSRGHSLCCLSPTRLLFL